MRLLVLIPMIMIIYDYFKLPIDRLYFTNPRRPLTGIQNTIRDVLNWCAKHEVKNYPGLILMRMHFNQIREEFDSISSTLEKKFYHDKDPWFEKNENYYYYSIDKFPKLYSLVKQIPKINPEVAAFAVIEGPMIIHPHRAESNEYLRYQLTIHGEGDCKLISESGEFIQNEGEDFFFDHGRYHELIKTGEGRRVLLILDVHR